MVSTLESTFEEAKTLPEERQERLGEWVRDFVEQERSAPALSTERREEVRRRLSAPEPVFAADAQVRALLGKFAVR